LSNRKIGLVVFATCWRSAIALWKRSCLRHRFRIGARSNTHRPSAFTVCPFVFFSSELVFTFSFGSAWLEPRWILV
jgi:hypothetical protein